MLTDPEWWFTVGTVCVVVVHMATLGLLMWLHMTRDKWMGVGPADIPRLMTPQFVRTVFGVLFFMPLPGLVIGTMSFNKAWTAIQCHDLEGWLDQVACTNQIEWSWTVSKTFAANDWSVVSYNVESVQVATMLMFLVGIFFTFLNIRGLKMWWIFGGIAFLFKPTWGILISWIFLLGHGMFEAIQRRAPVERPHDE